MYNNEKLKNAGIAVPPKTWTEFTEQTKKLQTANLAKYGYAGAWEQSQTLTNEHAFLAIALVQLCLPRTGSLLSPNNRQLTLSLSW